MADVEAWRLPEPTQLPLFQAHSGTPVPQTGVVARRAAKLMWVAEETGTNGNEGQYTYEGTYQMQNLIVGKAITGLSAFE